MTYEEALKEFDSNSCNGYSELANCFIRDALMKQIPKKPKVKTTFKSGYKTHECPNCGAEFGFCTRIKFCEQCGQRLDWSDEE